jgi:ATP-dependent Zn protease
MFSTLKTIVFWLFILFCLVLMWGVIERGRNATSSTEMSYSDLLNQVQNGQVLDAVVRGTELWGHLKALPNDQFFTTLPTDHEALIQAMVNAGAEVSINVPRRSLLKRVMNTGPIVTLFVAIVLAVPAFWVLFRKAGHPPALSILMIVPIVNLITLYVVAFSKASMPPAQKS